jgi:hypothetical protein
VLLGPRLGLAELGLLDADKADTYGPQIAVKLKVVDGEHNGHTFTDYANRDEDTGQIKQGTKAWGIYEACLGPDFHKKIKGMDAIVGKQYVAKVEQTKTGSRNKTEFGTAGPVPAGGFDGGGDIEPPDFSSLAS